MFTWRLHGDGKDKVSVYMGEAGGIIGLGDRHNSTFTDGR